MISSDTVRLVVKFVDFDGRTVIDPTDVKFGIYDFNKKPVAENLPAQKIKEGEYFYDYTLPAFKDLPRQGATGPTVLYIEAAGIYGGKPVVIRKQVQVQYAG